MGTADESRGLRGTVTAGGAGGNSATLRDYLNVVRRRKWVILLAVVLVPAVAVALSLRQKAVYQASAGVYLSSEDFASAVAGVSAPSGGPASDPGASTQAIVARVPAIAQRVVTALSLPISAQGFLAQSSVSSSTTSNILTFTVTGDAAALVPLMAAEYAKQYTLYRRRLDTASLDSARKALQRGIDKLRAEHAGSASLYADLIEKEQQLQTFEVLQTSNAYVVQTPTGAAKTSPKPKRNGILGLLLGVVLGIGLAFLWEALDTRVRSVQEVGERLGGLPLLARISEPSKRLRTRNQLVMLERPTTTQAETFRMLRTNLDFAMLDRDAGAIMVTSAVEQEGKSTTLANLAVALARAGRRVVLVDLDLRRPFLDRLFRLDGPGLTQVALGQVTLEEALATVAIADPDPRQARRRRNFNGNGNGDGIAKYVKGVLEVLPSGPIPPDPGEFVGTHALAEILEQLRRRAEIVLIDAPPVLHVGDAITLSKRVDAVVLVTRLKVVRRQMLGELARQLAAVRTPVIGFIATGTKEEQGYGDGDAYEYGYGCGYGHGSYYQRQPGPGERPAPARRET